MKKGIIGKKIGMTQIFDESGKVIPVTVVEAGPCMVIQKKTVENDGYDAIQVGFGDVKPQKLSKPAKGHFERLTLRLRKSSRNSEWTIAAHTTSATLSRLTPSLAAI